MVVKSNPLFYSKLFKYASSDDNIVIKTNTNFILTGRKSKGPENLRYYWKLVEGKPPQINDVDNLGCDIKMTSPDTPCNIVFELRVKDPVTEEQDIESLKFTVVETISE